jgi:hypothetical protein
MSPEGIKSFSHLLDALRSACPPHAGFAIGFDRLIVMMLGRDSVRDVIAFPKDKRGADLTIGSPAIMTSQQKLDYHFIEEKEEIADRKRQALESFERLLDVVAARAGVKEITMGKERQDLIEYATTFREHLKSGVFDDDGVVDPEDEEGVSDVLIDAMEGLNMVIEDLKTAGLENPIAKDHEHNNS